MSPRNMPGPFLIHRARVECAAVAIGPFTPVVFERWEFIGGAKGITLGYPSETANGHACIVWTSKPSNATGAAS